MRERGERRCLRYAYIYIYIYISRGREEKGVTKKIRYGGECVKYELRMMVELASWIENK